MSQAAQRRSADGPTTGDIVAEKFRVEQVIGEGGMGRVLAAENIATGKRVALKWVLDEERDGARQRFAREARAAGRIHHPNVVDVYDVVHHAGASCLVMELLRGESLYGLLERERPLPIAEAVGIAIEVARGLDAAHREGVIHRDLKPGNIFLCAGGASRVKVLDFGISKVIDGTDQGPATKTGAILGTPQYMTPEQVRGVKDIDSRVDVYALGVVLYEMLTGRLPLDHEVTTALLVLIVTTDPAPPRTHRAEIPVELEQTVLRALAKRPQDRFPDIASFARALEPFGDGTRFDAQGGGFQRRVTESLPPGRDESISRAATLEAAPTPASPPTSRTIERVPGLTRARPPTAVIAIGALLLVGAAIAGAWWVAQAPTEATSSGEPDAAARADRASLGGTEAEAPVVSMPGEATAGPSPVVEPSPVAEPLGEPGALTQASGVAEPSAVIPPGASRAESATAPRGARAGVSTPRATHPAEAPAQVVDTVTAPVVEAPSGPSAPPERPEASPPASPTPRAGTLSLEEF